MLPELRGVHYNSNAGGGGIPTPQDTPSLFISEYALQYQTLQQASDEFLSKPENQNVADALAQFNQYTKDHIKYSDTSLSYIAKALPICVSHQLNEDEKSRVRKIDGTPYISHPLAMATEAARMRLDPTHIIACLLHDVPEDVKLGGLQASEDWLKMIAETYKDYDDVDRLMRILRAEQKTESLDKLPDREQVISYYADTALGRRSLDYLQQSRQRHGNGHDDPSDTDRESIAKVLYDMDRMISDSFVGYPGQKVFDPSIIVVKILDTWQNLQTPGFLGKNINDPQKRKDASTIAKLIRARMLTNMAEFMGMRRVSSSMTENLSLLQNLYDIDDPQFDLATTIEEKRSAISAHTDRANKDGKILNQLYDTRNHYPHQGLSPDRQTPWAVGDKRNDSKDVPIVWHMAAYPGHTGSAAKLGTYHGHERSLTVSGPLGVADGALRAAIQTAYGRTTVDYQVTAKEEVVGKLRVEEAHPRWISTLKAKEHKPANPKQVPERNIFHPDVCKYTVNTTTGETKPVSLRNVDTSLVSLLEFCFSPREFLSDTTGEHDTPYMIMIGRKLFLATNQTDVTVWDMCQNEGIIKPSVHPLGGFDDDAALVIERDDHVLDRLRREGKLTMNMVVVTSGK
jgi:hypothetical protein